MAERVYLAIDLGAESGRVIAGRLIQGRVTLDELHRFPNGPVMVAGTRRWDLLRLWSEILEGLALAARRYGDAIVSAGVDTWGVDYVLLSAKDEFVGQPYNYRDARTQGVMEQVFARVPREEIFAQSGLQFMEINTLYQLVAMQTSDPKLLANAERFLMMPDVFHWLLCGSRVVEFTNATTTQFLQARQRTWAIDLLRKLEIPTHIFREIVAPGHAAGVAAPGSGDAHRSRADRSDRTGHARHGFGRRGGTDRAHRTRELGLYQFGNLVAHRSRGAGGDPHSRGPRPECHQRGRDRRHLPSAEERDGAVAVQECRHAFERQGRNYDYDQLTVMAREAEAFRSLIDPNDGCFLSPDDMSAAIRNWCSAHGQPVPETDGQLIRCALESLALKYRAVLEGLESLTGETIEVIHVVGGGSRNDLLNQFTADACGKPVIAGPTEATALGNVLVQARTMGDVGTLAEIRNIVRSSSELTTFEPRDRQAWDDAFQRFQSIS